MKTRIFLFGFLILWNTEMTFAQHFPTIHQREIDVSRDRELGLGIDMLAFFHDNEFESKMQSGYTLPGSRMVLSLQYNPLTNVHLELGGSALLFNGANKYPCYAYHDVGKWKGQQYQEGAHLLPWFRLVASVKSSTFVFGNIYGGSFHGINDVLYNKELDISSDPEAGIQYLLRTKYIDIDTWLNYQSYIFKMETHQEVFSIGINTKVRLDSSYSHEVYIPLNGILQHRGGEQDTLMPRIQTLLNASIGLGYSKDFQNGVLNTINAEISFLLCYMQRGDLWPFRFGKGMNVSVSAMLWKNFYVKVGHFYAPDRFETLFGSPFFGCMNLRKESIMDPEIRDFMMERPSTTYVNLNYTHSFTSKYHLGVYLWLYNLGAKNTKETNFSFGVFFKLTPYFSLKKF